MGLVEDRSLWLRRAVAPIAPILPGQSQVSPRAPGGNLSETCSGQNGRGREERRRRPLHFILGADYQMFEGKKGGSAGDCGAGSPPEASMAFKKRLPGPQDCCLLRGRPTAGWSLTLDFP